eukprot:CAMPEP_0197415000 /NCGR_PEP_ID=MMETSP1170-20131217/1608_1 /TAXON_ID=54406 /ORGANISM="Sarcinochrysis sp, Strain CCMP770" /LENGTH=235 /DNA_ID=CAMNT_0042941759 /DNA_START=119 /DNA_END=824 /DNA_ORIENTATION=+
MLEPTDPSAHTLVGVIRAAASVKKRWRGVMVGRIRVGGAFFFAFALIDPAGGLESLVDTAFHVGELMIASELASCGDDLAPRTVGGVHNPQVPPSRASERAAPDRVRVVLRRIAAVVGVKRHGDGVASGGLENLLVLEDPARPLTPASSRPLDEVRQDHFLFPPCPGHDILHGHGPDSRVVRQVDVVQGAELAGKRSAPHDFRPIPAASRPPLAAPPRREPRRPGRRLRFLFLRA